MRKDATGHTADQRNVWWSFRDSAWVCRAKHEGRTYVKTICVTRLAKRGHDGYELTKTNAYDALCDWQRHVEAGGEPGEGAIPMDADEAGADEAATVVARSPWTPTKQPRLWRASSSADRAA